MISLYACRTAGPSLRGAAENRCLADKRQGPSRGKKALRRKEGFSVTAAAGRSDEVMYLPLECDENQKGEVLSTFYRLGSIPERLSDISTEENQLSSLNCALLAVSHDEVFVAKIAERKLLITRSGATETMQEII